jgi:ferredoxin
MKILDKAKLSQFLEELRPKYEVIAPLHEGKDILFGRLDSTKLAIDFVGKTRLSPKEYLFPQREVLFTFEENKKVEIKAYLDETKRVIWGIRPCDLYGIKVLNMVYFSDYIDPYYQARSTNTLLLGLNCNEAEASCFCSSLVTGPFAREGFDLLFTDLGDAFLVEIGSKAGEMLIEEANLFIEAAEKDKEKANLLESKSKQSFTNQIDIKKVEEKLPDAFDKPLWADEASKCFFCGACNFVCPACHCFNIEDIKVGQRTERVRYWDSCQLGGFTQMAAYNSRTAQVERLRQRIYHKFSYIPDRYNGQLGCTGCGRCIDVCLGEIDIAQILRKVANE